MADDDLNAHLAGSYGIFSGAPKGWATILFSAKAARWVADEHWHSQQQGRFLADGRYELKVPYSVPRELLMDVLHYGGDAEIVSFVSDKNTHVGSVQFVIKTAAIEKAEAAIDWSLPAPAAAG